jgi:hypothetical protein
VVPSLEFVFLIICYFALLHQKSLLRKVKESRFEELQRKSYQTRIVSWPVGSSILLSLLTLLRNATELRLKEWRKKSHEKLVKIMFLMTSSLSLLLQKPLLRNAMQLKYKMPCRKKL